MSFVDFVKSQVHGHVEGKDADLASTMLTRFGGSKAESLVNLAKAFHQGGLGAAVNSWISTGENHNLSSDQVIQALGRDRVAEVAAKFGMTPEEASGRLAQVLPVVVDRLTPAGKLPHEEKKAS
jgi:uncharacterized protein YidB (DUF937 family)